MNYDLSENNYFNFEKSNVSFFESDIQSENDNKSEINKFQDIKREIFDFNNNQKKYDFNSCNDFEIFEENKDNIFGEDDYYINEKNYIGQNDKIINENINTITLNKGRIINTYNATISNVMNDLFNNDIINFETKKDMQLLKTKKRRRTKKEIETEKSLKTDKKHEKKNRGRIKKSQKINLVNIHSKKADDNIIIKIHSFFIKSVKNWLNNSFIDDNYNFLENNIKFLKISSITIGNNLKKSIITKLMKTTFKEIFSSKISIKYKKIDKDFNKNLIIDIYKQNKQIFVIFILNLTFIEVFHFFNGQSNINDFRKSLQHYNLNNDKIDKFYNNFQKIDYFLKKIYSQEKGKESEYELKDYIQRISLLCVNYENWFERKFNRKSYKSKTI